MMTMTKFLKTKLGWLVTAVAVLILPSLYVFADYTLPQPGTALTVFSIAGTGSCSGKTCPDTILMDSAGAEKATLANPVVTSADPCASVAKSNLAIDSNTTTLTQIIAANSTNKIYVCSLALISASANTLSLITGTGTNCGTSTAGLIGGTTVANSLSFAANGGLTLGNGNGSVAVSAASSELCLTLGTAAYVAGNLTYVQQ